MSVPTMLQYMKKAGKDATYETTYQKPKLWIMTGKQKKKFRGLRQYGVTSITPQPNTHMTAQLFQAVLV